ncbi:MAG TPA: YbhB/YbcL family Raf kinase inhibitor-like protein [Rhizomicrobium sp.]|jgi:hypothetical protein
MQHSLKLAILALTFSATAAMAQSPMVQAPAPGTRPTPMVLTSSSFEDGGVIPDKYSGASSSPVSPALSWTGAPANTQAFAIVMHDLDTMPRAAGPDNLHWLIFNIPAGTTSLPEGVPNSARLSDGSIQLVNGGNKVGYLPLGARGVYHHYVIELYALDGKIPVTPEGSRQDATSEILAHTLAHAAYVGRFHLPN